jgi:hypothetical protein
MGGFACAPANVDITDVRMMVKLRRETRICVPSGERSGLVNLSFYALVIRG